MLTPEDLTVIRAALRYFSEELIPHGPEAIGDYLDAPLPEGLLTGQSLIQLRDRLASCDLRWARYSHETGKLLDGKLLRSIEEVDPSLQAPLATVLIPTCK